MCACVVAFSGHSLGRHRHKRTRVAKRRYSTGSDTGAITSHEVEEIVSPAASAPPSLGTLPLAPLSTSSTRNSRTLHCDVAIRVLLKKHECQVKLPEDEFKTHLHAIFCHLRPQDSIKLAVRLESWKEEHIRYLVVITTTGRQDTEESIIVGFDVSTRNSTTCTVGLVLPIWCDTTITLDGDGGFKVQCYERTHVFKPVSVQAMWSALQTLHRCADIALRNNYYEGSLYLTWTCFYASRIASSRLHVNEWDYRETLYYEPRRYFEETDPERAPVEALIRTKLKEVMKDMDLDNCTSRDIRVALEAVIDMDLRNYKEYIDKEMLTVLGQMDCASKILDYLYLGSEWNACNLEELEELGITHILNVTIEVDNFFPKDFQYQSIRLYDLETSDLLPHWNKTWKYITAAKNAGGKVLVHCRMGISRSAATVCAYLMKLNLWTHGKALHYVHSCRSIIDPNPAFRQQLVEYQGIIFASAQRHNILFRSQSEDNLSSHTINESTMNPSAGVVSALDDFSNQEDWMDVDPDDFDLHRHLLDIAKLMFSKISRSKSWSPEEKANCYGTNNSHRHTYHFDRPLHAPLHHSDARTDLLQMSEPDDLLFSLSDDIERRRKVGALRKKFSRYRASLQRQGTAVTRKTNAPPQLEEIAQSEDSVFVHHDSGLFRHPTPAFAEKTQYNEPILLPASTPRAWEAMKNSSSSSCVGAKDVDVSLLKSRFNCYDGEAVEDLPEGDGAQSGCFETEGLEMVSPLITTTVPVRDIVAVLECSDDLSITAESSKKTNKTEISNNFKHFADTLHVKGHHKTLSLPPSSVDAILSNSSNVCDNSTVNDDNNVFSRSRSYSEAQLCSVKKIVTEIENRYGPDISNNEANTDGLPIHRVMSLPNSRPKTASPSTAACTFLPVTEAASEPNCVVFTEQAESQEESRFYIGDSDEISFPLVDDAATFFVANDNNNNRTKSSNHPLSDPFSPVTVCDLTNNRASLKNDKHLDGNDYEDVKHHKPENPQSPDGIRTIEVVGFQLTSDSEDGSQSKSPTSSYVIDDVLSSNVAQCLPHKKRGLVRKMARKIERNVRRLTGHSSKVRESALRPRRTVSEPVPIKCLSSSALDIKEPLIIEYNFEEANFGGISYPGVINPYASLPPASLWPEIRVRDLVDKFDPSPQLSVSLPARRPHYDFSSNICVCEPASLSRNSKSDLAPIVAPIPQYPSDRAANMFD